MPILPVSSLPGRGHVSQWGPTHPRGSARLLADQTAVKFHREVSYHSRSQYQRCHGLRQQEVQRRSGVRQLRAGRPRVRVYGGWRTYDRAFFTKISTNLVKQKRSKNAQKYIVNRQTTNHILLMMMIGVMCGLDSGLGGTEVVTQVVKHWSWSAWAGIARRVSGLVMSGMRQIR